MPVMNMFPGGSTLQIPLEACTAFSASAGNAKVELTWTDPKDKYATPEGDISDTGDQLVSEWDHTILVRKTGSQPAGPNDGTVVVSSSVRNQYQSTPYTDTGLTNDTTYYYAVFAYNKDGVASAGAFTSCHLYGFDDVLDNNSWAQINQAAQIGLASSIWSIGDEKNFTAGSETLTAVILDFNHDDAADGSGKIPISFGLKELMKNTHGWRWVASNLSNSYLRSGFPEYLNDTVLPSFPEDMQSVLKLANKTLGSSTQTKINLLTIQEATGTSNLTNSSDTASGGGYQYPYYGTVEKRIKKLSNGAGAASAWYLASNQQHNTYARPIQMTASGETRTTGQASLGVCFCFYV